MIDRQARNEAAIILQDFAFGRISNYQFEDRYPDSETDIAIGEIKLQTWFHYSDVKEHTIEAKYQEDEELRFFIDRCVLFLRSDCEFRWPRQQRSLWQSCLELLGLAEMQERSIDGEARLWPFFDEAQYKAALLNHQESCT